MPDLDLIKQAEQGSARPIRRSPGGRRRLHPTRVILPLISCRSSKRLGGASMNGCSPPRLPGARPLHFSWSKAGMTTACACFSTLAQDDSGPQQAGLAIGVVDDTASAVE